MKNKKNLTGWLIGAGIAVLGLAVFFIIEAFTTPANNQPKGAGGSGMPRPGSGAPTGPYGKPPVATGSDYTGTWGVDPSIFTAPTSILVPGPLDIFGNPTAAVSVPTNINFNAPPKNPPVPPPYDPSTDPGFSYASGDQFETLSKLRKIA